MCTFSTFYSEDVGEMVKMTFIWTFFSPEEGGKFKLLNGTDKMLILSFFCINQIIFFKANPNM